MAVGLHRRRGHDMRSFDPHAGGLAERMFRTLDESLERFGFGSDTGAGIETGEVVGAAGRNRYRVRSPEDSSVVVEVPSATTARLVPGTKATIALTRAGAVIIAPPVGGERGKSESQPQRRRADAAPILIVRTEPATVMAGTTEEVTFYGAGFRETPVDVLVPVVPDLTLPESEWEVDDEVTIGPVTWVSAGEITAEVTVDVGAAATKRISVDPQRG